MFIADKIYATTDPELRAVAANQTLAKWRFEGRGPKYFKAGSKVLYRGRDLNLWIESQLVATSDQPAEAVA